MLLNYPFAKIVSNRAFHVLAQLVLGRHFRDATNNLKLMRRDVVDRLILSEPGFAVNAEVGLQLILMGYPITGSAYLRINREFDMGASSFRLIKVGGGYFSVLWRVLLARAFGSGPYGALSAKKRLPDRSRRFDRLFGNRPEEEHQAAWSASSKRRERVGNPGQAGELE